VAKGVKKILKLTVLGVQVPAFLIELDSRCWILDKKVIFAMSRSLGKARDLCYAPACAFD
jgi:hypothetical protein